MGPTPRQNCSKLVGPTPTSADACTSSKKISRSNYLWVVVYFTQILPDFPEPLYVDSTSLVFSTLEIFVAGNELKFLVLYSFETHYKFLNSIRLTRGNQTHVSFWCIPRTSVGKLREILKSRKHTRDHWWYKFWSRDVPEASMAVLRIPEVQIQIPGTAFETDFKVFLILKCF